MHSPPDEAYEVFRRAITERDPHAWSEIHRRYRLLLIAWARQCSVNLLISEQFEDIADQALARAWSALSTKQFESFPGLPAVLGYLRTCVSAVMIDMARAQATRQRTMQRLEVGPAQTPEEIVLDDMLNSQLWQLVRTMVNTVQEQVILERCIVLGQPPRLIYSARPDLFRSVEELYAIKRNFINRLQRNRALLDFFEANIALHE